MKLLLAVAVVGVFVEFVVEIFSVAHTGELSSIEVPLAGLFTWVQVVHAFDVPARRDLLFSLAAAAALVTVASAQAVSVGFLGFVAIWLVASLIGLSCSWRSMAGGRWRLPAGGLLGATVLIVAIALVLEVVLPLPRASQALTLPSSLTSYLPLPAGGLTEGGAHPTEPAKAGNPGGRTGIGGFVGMAGPLDTALRASLGNEVVMRVRADRPGYFLGTTYDRWNGQSWTEVCRARYRLADARHRLTLPGAVRHGHVRRAERPDLLRRAEPAEPALRDLGSRADLLPRPQPHRRLRPLVPFDDRHDGRNRLHRRLGRRRGAGIGAHR